MKYKAFMKYKAIVFDFDDTLVTSLENGIITHQKVAEHMGIRVPSREEFNRLWGLPWESIVYKLWPGIDFQELRKTYYKFRNFEGRGKMEGVDEVIPMLKNSGFALGILTSRERKTFDELMELFKIPDCFDFSITKSELEYHKPDKRAFDSIVSDFGTDVLYVGDSIVDFQAATNAGVDFVGVVSGGTTKEDFEKAGAKHVIDSLKELPAHIGVLK